MSRKYEIVNVGGVNRVRALRSWVVQGRQVNVGDVGGAVFDERTLSQDGACWIFSGRLNNPLVRVGGDSVVNIVDVNLDRAPFVNIFGTSSLDANAGLSFAIRDLNIASPLTPGKMEQGGCEGSVGQPLTKVTALSQIRSKERMFTGGGAWVVPAPAEGYSIRVVAVDTDGIVTYNSGNTSTEVTVPAGAHAYAYITVMKSPLSAIVPADVTAAALTFQSYAEATLNIVDSHITVTSPNTGYAYIAVSGDYQGNVTNIEGSTLQVNRTGGTPWLNLVCDLINTSATVNMGARDVSVLGVYKNVKNLVWGAFSWVRPLKSRTIIQATDCDNFVMDGANIPGGTVEATNTPLVFIRCNMNKASIVNQPLINNTYIDINFDLATADLGKLIVNGYTMVSSNVNGMYRLHATSDGSIGALVESHESIRDSGIDSNAIAATYGTTIYKDAYFNGLFELAGTNVFGSKSPSHPIEQVLNVQPRVVQGTFNTIASGQVITGVVPDATRVSIPTRIRLNRHNGVVVHLPAGLEAKFMAVDPNNKIISASVFVKNEASVPAYAQYPFAFIQFRKTGDAPITPEDLAGVTMTVYNGCKISKSSQTSIYMRGNVRVEDSAMLYDAKIEGSGYFGGNAVMSEMNVNGYAYMKDNTLCTKTSGIVQTFASLVMEGNAVYNPNASLGLSGLNVFMYDNSKVLGDLSSASFALIMRDNATITAAGNLSGACVGVATIKDNAVINTSISTIGDITLCGGYVSTPNKKWTGKRVIDNDNEPQYDNNVKTQYDF
jgi:hypothetical protein